MKKQDRRTEKTKQAIFEAFSGLMREKKYSHITIQEIIDKANVGRSTFYSHFSTKDELLSSCIDNSLETINSHTHGQHHCFENKKEEFIPVAEILEHIQDNNLLIKGMMNAESSELLFEQFKSYWHSKMENYFEKKIDKLGSEINTDLPIEILINHITSTLVEFIKWWIGNDMPYPPAKMEEYWLKLILPCINIDPRNGKKSLFHK